MRHALSVKEKRMKKELASGKTLHITIGSFDECLDLWMTINEEAKGINMSSEVEIDTNLLKNIFCTANSSRKIKEKLDPLLKRCLYDNAPINEKTFQSIEAREDYLEIIEVVAVENIRPFVKGLVRKYKAIFSQLATIFQGLKQQKQPT